MHVMIVWQMMKKMEKARKKAESISENVDVSEREKWKQIKEYALCISYACS